MLRLLDKLNVSDIAIAGFDTFSHNYNESYADKMIPSVLGVMDVDAMNRDIKDIYKDFRSRNKDSVKVEFITSSDFMSEFDTFNEI